MKQLDCMRASWKLYGFSFSSGVHASPSNWRWSAEHSFLPCLLKSSFFHFPRAAQNLNQVHMSLHVCDCDMWLITIRKRIVHVTALFVQAEVPCLQSVEKNGLVSWLPGKARSKQRHAIWYTLNFLQLTTLARSGAPLQAVSPLRGQAGPQVFSRVFSSHPYWVGNATETQTANEFWACYRPEC